MAQAGDRRLAIIAVVVVAVVVVSAGAAFLIFRDRGVEPVTEPVGGEAEGIEGMMEGMERMMPMEGSDVGLRAPDFTLRSIDGREFSLSEFRGRNVALWFMIPAGCPICASQVEELKRLQEELGDDLVVIAVTLLDYEGIEGDLAKFRDEKGLREWIYAVDTQQLGIKYNIVEMGVVLIDPEGVIIHRGIPQTSFEEMLSAIMRAQ